MSDKKKKFRSSESYGKLDKDGFIHRSWMKNQGLPNHVFDGRPVIGICNTWSELTPCNAHLRELAEYVKRGVWEAGGLPLEFPVMSLGETQMRPTAMLYRNLLAMEVEESIRGNPIDGVVLLGGCDKTTPGQLMGAASVNLPAIVVSSGPMLNGKYRGSDIGSGTDVWKFSESVRAGLIPAAQMHEAEYGMSRSRGTCMTMGTASSVACLIEAMGLSLPYNSSFPAVDAGRQRIAHLSGAKIVELVEQDITLDKLVTKESMENAIMVNTAIGGSTNSVMHLLAIAGRLGLDISLDDFDRLSRDIPLLVNLMPSGEYLMEDFHYAGGLPVVLKYLADKLHLNTQTVTGGSLKHFSENAECFNSEVIRSCDNPVSPDSGIWVLKGNICPNGAVLKISAATPSLLKHKGKAVVFDSIEDYKERIDSPDLDVDENSVLILRGCGPKGYPGMPEVGNMQIPKKLLKRGVSDMIRISDARMSGTAFGTVVLHVSPESEDNGPLSIIRDGDLISLDARNRTLNVELSSEEYDARMNQLKGQPKRNKYQRGYAKMYIDSVMQADKGADLDFLVGASGSDVARESH